MKTPHKNYLFHFQANIVQNVAMNFKNIWKMANVGFEFFGNLVMCHGLKKVNGADEPSIQ